MTNSKIKKNWIELLLSMILVVCAQTVVAQPVSSTAAAGLNSVSTAPLSQGAVPLKDKKNFGFLIGLETSSNFYKESSPDREGSTDLLLNPTYQLTDLYSLAAKTIISKEMTGAKNTTMTNTSLSLRRKGIEFESGASLSHSIAVILPTNEESRETDRLRGAVALSTGLSFNFLNVKSKYLLALQKNFHEFTINANQSPNVEYTLRHDVEFNIGLTQKISLLPSGYYRSGRTYGQYDRNNYGVGVDLNYTTDQELDIYVGTGNEGPAYKSNGKDSNIKFYDQNTSVLRAGLSYNY